MSKQKSKDKKNENIDQIQRQFEEQKRQLLDARFHIKKLEQRLNYTTEENYRLEKQRSQQFLHLTQKIEQLNIKNQTNEKRLITMRNDLTNSEVENKKLINTIAMMEKNTNEERQDKTKEYQEMKKNYTFEISKLENMLSDYKLYMSERDSRQKQIGQLIEAKEIEVANRIREVANKEREKVQATDKIRDEMGNKIRQMRQNLLSLKKEELDTTTRLTMLQNHQLTSELQYQSKQTQKIIFKNEELEAKLNKLQQQLDIHKQVEDELAKRSHFSKGIIKKLHLKIQELEQELLQIKKTKDTNNLSSTLKNTNNGSSESFFPQKNVSSDKNQQKNIVLALDKQLQKTQKKYIELFSKYEQLKKQKEQIFHKFEESKQIKNEIFLIIYRYYNDIVHDGKTIDQSNLEENNLGDYKLKQQINLSQLRQKKVQKWSLEEIKFVSQIILNIIHPYLTKSNLNVPSIRKNLYISDSESKMLLPRISTQRSNKFPFSILADENSKINQKHSQHSDICSAAKNEVQKQKISLNIASKIVTSKLRDWGKPVSSASRNNLKRKYKLSASYRN